MLLTEGNVITAESPCQVILQLLVQRITDRTVKCHSLSKGLKRTAVCYTKLSSLEHKNTNVIIAVPGKEEY